MSQQLTSDKELLQLHIAEYQALTNRASYWIVLQYSLMATVPVQLGIAFGAWQVTEIRAKEAIIWITLALLQFIALLWALTLVEQFSIVMYLECYLRPQIKDALASDKLFFGYEPYLKIHRPYNHYWGHYFIPSLTLIVLVITTAIRYQSLTQWDIWGMAANAALLVTLGYLSNKSRMMLEEWSRYDDELAKHLDKTYGCKSKEAGKQETKAVVEGGHASRKIKK